MIDIEKQVTFWRDGAQEDLTVAQELLERGGSQRVCGSCPGGFCVLDASVVTVVRNYLRILQQHGVLVRFAVVYGSQVTGTTGMWSDIDLLVVSPRFDTAYDYRIVDLLWRLSARVDSRLEPIPCGEHQWEQDDASAIVEIARRHGERVTVSA